MFRSFSFSATLKSSKFQVAKGMIIAKSAVVNKTTNISRNIVPIEKKADHLRIEERNRLDTSISTSVGWKT